MISTCIALVIMNSDCVSLRMNVSVLVRWISTLRRWCPKSPVLLFRLVQCGMYSGGPGCGSGFSGRYFGIRKPGSPIGVFLGSLKRSRVIGPRTARNCSLSRV